MSILKLNSVYKKYFRGHEAFNAVNNISLEINPGDFINIIGKSGSGKSTLLKLCAGLLRPTAGNIEFNGENLNLKSDDELSYIRNNQIGYIPQNAQALENLNVIENILLPFYLYKHAGDGEGYARILLEKFGIEKLFKSYPDELSGGELRRVLIARAMINNPKIIIADEPTSSLDAESSKNVMEIFNNLNSDGITIILVSHDLETLKYGKKIFKMEAGNLIFNF